MRLKKSQLLNYEFSSELLKLKFQETILQKEDLGSEVNNLIMESNVMNNTIGHIHQNFSWKEKIGESLINGIHYLVFKPFIYLASENDYLFELQKAFYLEKNQKCNIAIPIYKKLEMDLRNTSGDDHAFVLLHLGYCEAILGNQEQAVKNLSALLSEYTGSHFADSAQVMLNIISSNIKKEAKFEKNNLSINELAKKYYNTSLYRKAIEQFDKLEILTADEKFMKARSLERLGNITEASKLYLEVIVEGDAELAKKANRRLLLIGNFYDGGEDIKKLAKKNAEKFGDSVISEFVETSVTKQSKSIVLEELQKESKSTTENKSLLQEKIIISNEQMEKNDSILQKQDLSHLEKVNPKKSIPENKDCLQFRSNVGGLHKAEKVLVLDGKFVTIYMGKTLATPTSEFVLLESCKIHSPFTIATDKLGKVSVRTAIIKGDIMELETDSGVRIIKVGEIQSMVPDSILEKIRFIVVRRKDGNFHYCNTIEFIGSNDVRLNSRSGVSVTKDIKDIEYMQLGENSTNFVIYRKDKLVIKSAKNLVFSDTTISFQNDLGELEEVNLENVHKIESE